MLKKMLIGAALAVLGMSALSGCVSADGAVKEATDSEKFASICRSEPLVHATFVLLAAENGMKPSIVAAEATAHGLVASICSNPPQDVPSALVALADAYARVLAVSETAADKESG